MATLLLKGESWWLAWALCRSPEGGTIMLGRAGAGSLYWGGKAMVFSLAVGQLELKMEKEAKQWQLKYGEVGTRMT
ncbi:unnamed protein product [Fusarium graminearum]|nr:unnamed protein product [Fusarium graminearum]CAG1977919.1 unnamed protein product [Fusarium graminearum]VTO93971.1 unnamed protein product [Fusarium graminearum]